MCGLVFTTAPLNPAAAPWRASTAVLECRGPDARGQSHSDRFSAGHCRLEIIGLGDVGRQPYSTDPDREILLFNGEIYNYRELAISMGIAADSDTHVLFHLLSSGQHERLSELRGMFAFVYWRRDPEVIVTGRDLFGIKPLYAAIDAHGSLSFASIPAALTPLLEIIDVDPVALTGFLATGYFPTGVSPYRVIEKCPEGTIMTWRRNGRTWSAESTPLSIASWPALAPAAAIAGSVDAHLVADVPVGVLLSGGVDSTLIAALAARRVAELRTFSLVNPADPDIDEARYAAWNARLLGAHHTEVAFDAAGSLDVIRAIVRSTGEPFGDAAYVPLALVCARVADDVKVVLAGEGADELFAGYRRYDVERLRSRWLTGVPLRALSRARNARDRYAERPPSTRVRSWAYWGEDDDYLAYSYLLSAEWRAVGKALPDATRQALALFTSRWSNSTPISAALGLPTHRSYDLSQWLPNVFLEKSDRASMLNSVEVRVPYLDPVVARAAADFVPADSTKAPLRRALTQLLPGVRLPPRKMGLSVDTGRLMKSSGLDAYADFVLHDPASVLSRIGVQSSDALAQRAALNSTLAFRLGMLGLWQTEVLDAAATPVGGMREAL